MLLGVQGCGKSLAVKVIAHEWKMPLFRLDMNLVFSGVQGSAEWIFHRALEAVESVAPAILWIDEIEMGIAGYSEGETGSNTRIFSTFLTWMQEHRADVFVAATANRINLLPAEIITSRVIRAKKPWFVAVAAVILGGRFLVQPVLRAVARTRLRELFTAAALLLGGGGAAFLEGFGECHLPLQKLLAIQQGLVGLFCPRHPAASRFLVHFV